MPLKINYICELMCVIEFNVEVQLDRLKQQQKGAIRRALFLDTQLPSLQRTLTVPNGARVCSDTKIYLRVSLSPKYNSSDLKTTDKQDINANHQYLMVFAKMKHPLYLY